jgi:hypothetical protein
MIARDISRVPIPKTGFGAGTDVDRVVRERPPKGKEPCKRGVELASSTPLACDSTPEP